MTTINIFGSGTWEQKAKFLEHILQNIQPLHNKLLHQTIFDEKPLSKKQLEEALLICLRDLGEVTRYLRNILQEEREDR